MSTVVLKHYGTKGMKWGVRRYQNDDGSLTLAGRIRYQQQASRDRKDERKYEKYLRDSAKRNESRITFIGKGERWGNDPVNTRFSDYNNNMSRKQRKAYEEMERREEQRNQKRQAAEERRQQQIDAGREYFKQLDREAIESDRIRMQANKGSSYVNDDSLSWLRNMSVDDFYDDFEDDWY